MKSPYVNQLDDDLETVEGTSDLVDQQWQDFVAFSHHLGLAVLAQQTDMSFSQQVTALDPTDSEMRDLLEPLPVSPSPHAPCVSEPPSVPEHVKPGPVAVAAAAIPADVSAFPAAVILESAVVAE